MDPSQYLKNYPQPLHLHPNSSFRLHNNSQDNSFHHSSPRSRDRPYFNRSRGRGAPYNRHRQQNSESQYSSDGSSFNDSSSSSNMNSPFQQKFNQRNFHSNKQTDISQYFHPSMLEDPWAGLISSIAQSRQTNRQSGKVATYDYSSDEETETPSSTQQDESDSDEDEQEEE